MKNKRLGRGLEALIPQISPEEPPERKDSLNEIDVRKIKANPGQPRLEFDPDLLEQLKQSIAENGVIQPITVHEVDGGYEVIAGERRLRAVTDLGFKTIPAFVMEVKSEDHLLELALIENIQREDLNAIEVAKAYHRLQKEYGLTQDEVAQKVGKDRATVANHIRLLKLPEKVQESLKNNEISMGHARAFMALNNVGDQIQIWKSTLKHGWSVRKVEEEIRNQNEKKSTVTKPKSETISPYIQETQDRLRATLGSQVKISGNGRKGKIEIAYFSSDDLDRLVELIENV